MLCQSLFHPAPEHLAARVQGTFGPFRPNSGTQVPVWMALMLHRRRKCRINPPAWLTPAHLEGERARRATCHTTVLEAAWATQGTRAIPPGADSRHGPELSSRRSCMHGQCFTLLPAEQGMQRLHQWSAWRPL